MGPRSHERGNPSHVERSPLGMLSFNGAAFSRTRKLLMAFVEFLRNVSLQWGRVLTNAETPAVASASVAGRASLQWGRVLTNAETEPFVRYGWR